MKRQYERVEGQRRLKPLLEAVAELRERVVGEHATGHRPGPDYRYGLSASLADFGQGAGGFRIRPHEAEHFFPAENALGLEIVDRGARDGKRVRLLDDASHPDPF